MQMFDHSQIEFNVDTFNIPDVPEELGKVLKRTDTCLLYTSPSPRD